MAKELFVYKLKMMIFGSLDYYLIGPYLLHISLCYTPMSYRGISTSFFSISDTAVNGAGGDKRDGKDFEAVED